MEPLGAVASIVTLLELVHKITVLVIKTRASIKHAIPDLIRLVAEVKSLRGILEGLIDIASDNTLQSASRLRHLEALARSDGLLETCSSELQELERWLRAAVKSNANSAFGALKWSFKDKDLSRRLEGIARVKSTLQLGLAVDHTQILLESRAATLSLAQTVKHTDAEQHRQTIINWLTSLAADTAADTHVKVKARSTGDWFLKGAVFKNWIDSPHSVLWLHGIPGAGKSVMCGSIVDVLNQMSSKDDPIVVVNFFFDFRARDHQDACAFLSSILVQIQKAKGEIILALSSLHEYHSKLSRSPSEMELLDALRIVLLEQDRVYTIIDGLDECRVQGRIIETLEEICRWQMPHHHLMVASRKHPEIQKAFIRMESRECQMDVTDIKEDIERYIHQSVAEDARLNRWPSHVQDEISSQIAAKAGGMFRWADCQLQAVKQCRNLKGLRNTLSTLPTTLEGTYARILDSIDPAYSVEAQKMLMWLCFAVRPLRITEMIEALAIDLEQSTYDKTQRFEDPDDLMTLCGSLTISEQGVLKLAHYSVKEYLTSGRILSSPQSLYHMSKWTADFSITNSCLIYLQYFDRMQQANPTSYTYLPLYPYAISHWFHHYKFSNRPAELTALVLSTLGDTGSIFVTDSWRFPSPTSMKLNLRWNKSFEDFDNIADSACLLHYAAVTGCCELIRVVLERGRVDVNATDECFETPLVAASKEGCYRCVELLLCHGADVNFKTRWSGTALHAAAHNGHLRVVQLLISHGSDVNLMCGARDTPLQAAIRSPIHKDGMVKMLLIAGAEPKQDPLEEGDLALAARLGNEFALFALLAGGTHPDVDEGEALQIALASGNMKSAHLLVAAGADVRLRGGYYGSPVSAAADGGIEPLRFLFTEHCVEPDFCDQEGRTALHVAASCQNTQVIKYLLELGLKTDHEDTKGWSAIHYAASMDNVTSLELLLATGSPIPHLEPDVWSPLHVACRNNGPEALDLLLQYGFRPTTVTTSMPRRQWDLYDIAWAYGNRKLVEGSGTPKHELLHLCRKQNLRNQPVPKFARRRDWLCDGCIVGYVNKFHGYRYDLRFKCTICPDFDYCFMCIASAEKTHAHPFAEVLA